MLLRGLAPRPPLRRSARLLVALRGATLVCVAALRHIARKEEPTNLTQLLTDSGTPRHCEISFVVLSSLGLLFIIPLYLACLFEGSAPKPFLAAIAYSVPGAMLSLFGAFLILRALGIPVRQQRRYERNEIAVRVSDASTLTGQHAAMLGAPSAGSQAIWSFVQRPLRRNRRIQWLPPPVSQQDCCRLGAGYPGPLCPRRPSEAPRPPPASHERPLWVGQFSVAGVAESPAGCRPCTSQAWPLRAS
jgi:hypothetical protein